MLKYYKAYLKQHVKPVHIAKIEWAVILFCLLTFLLGPPLSLRSKDNSSIKEIAPSVDKQAALYQAPPPTLPYFVKE
jgi:hypothetical protein